MEWKLQSGSLPNKIAKAVLSRLGPAGRISQSSCGLAEFLDE